MARPAGRPAGYSARISLDGMVFRGHHGDLPAERKLGGDFRVDVKIDPVMPSRFRDRLSETADYAVVFSRVRKVVERRRYRTLEALAKALLDSVTRVPRVRGVRVRVAKLATPLGNGATAAVELRAGSLE